MRNSDKGYKLLWIDGKHIPEHRYVIEQHIGRKLNREEIVHHLNGDTHDNRIENLVVCKNQTEHLQKYHRWTDEQKESFSKKKTKYGKVELSLDAKLVEELKRILRKKHIRFDTWMRNAVEEYMKMNIEEGYYEQPGKDSRGNRP